MDGNTHSADLQALHVLHCLDGAHIIGNVDVYKRQILQASDTWLRPVYDALHRKLCQEAVLHGDETTLQVLKEPGRTSTSKSYMWLYRTSGCAAYPIVLYEYQPSRKAEHAEAFLKDFSGWLHADGYQRCV